MPPYFSTFLTMLGFSLGTFLLARYRLWKVTRPSIPMELQSGVWIPDGKLKRWERRVAWIWGGGTVLLLIGYIALSVAQ